MGTKRCGKRNFMGGMSGESAAEGELDQVVQRYRDGMKTDALLSRCISD